MNIQDPISDMIVIINNGQKSNKDFVICKYSNIKLKILKILKIKGFILNYILQEKNIIKINLKYFNNKPVIEKFVRISKPSLRIYYKIKDINKLKNDYGIFIISTSNGLLTNKESLIKKIGGEAICYIY